MRAARNLSCPNAAADSPESKIKVYNNDVFVMMICHFLCTGSYVIGKSIHMMKGYGGYFKSFFINASIIIYIVCMCSMMNKYYKDR